VSAPGAPAGERRPQDPEVRLEHARALAWGALNRRERTEAELRALLARRRVDPEDAEVVVRELLETGYVDDVRFAERFADDRRRLDEWGGERIEQRLRALGVVPDVARAAAARAAEEELEAAVGILRRRVPAPPTTPRERDRALAILLRRGYAPDVAYDALRRPAGVPAPD
jgi:regulatory protein